MEWLNHHHLLYFWTVAREGSIARASEVLHLTPQAISAQIKTLEEALGVELFERAGRGLKLTDTGELVRRYADEIFTLSRELLDTVKGRPIDRPRLLRVGVADALPKLICHRLLEPALHTPEPVQLVCREEGLELLLADLALHRIDMVLSDSPLPTSVRVKAYNHLLGQSGIVWMASEELAAELRVGFPASLNGAPVLVPTTDTAVRRALDLWLHKHDLRPRIVGEIADSALLKAFGEAGEGLVPVSAVIAAEVKRHYNLFEVAPAEGVIESYYAITVDRRVRHPAVVAICEAARATLR